MRSEYTLGRGAYAISRAVSGGSFEAFEAVPNETEGQLTIVTIRGALYCRASAHGDSYEAITARFAEACQGPAPVIALRIDSPGGTLDGLSDCLASMRSKAKAHNKRIHAYVEGA
jgi:ClpP class serine protease